MSNPSDSRPAGSVVLFTNGDTSYEFFRDLGEGRVGERILLARTRTPKGLGDCVVLKFRARARMEEEVRLAQCLGHPCIARVHGLYEISRGLCVAMEHVEGLSLNTLLAVAQARGRYFSEAFILYVGAEVAAALAYTHERTDDAGFPPGIVNRDVNPARIRVGPLYTEAFVSDVLGARLMGAEFSLDMKHVFFGKAKEHSRYTLALSAVHDWGRAGGRAPSVTLAHADATAVVVVRPDYEVYLVAGWGGRPGEGGAWGAVAGAGVDAGTETLNLRLRLEARRQHGGFRQGFFGADYELARFQAAGPDGGPVADAGFPDGYSAFGEAEVGWDAVSYGGLYRHLKLSLGAEAFSWGRFDVDGSVAVQLFERSLEVALKGMGVGMGQPGARYLGAAEVRWRFLGGKLYAMGTGGTLLFPTADGTLRPGAFASVGLGVDNAR